MTYTITNNATFNSIEIAFDCKPTAAVRDALKALKFRWHSVKKVWYGYTDEATARAAIDGKPVKADKPAKPAEKVNKYGVKVGDIFHAQWGYDQTNNNFFQVIALAGEGSVRVREVCPVCIDSEATGPMAEDRVFKTNTNGKLLQPKDRSLFIKDQEKGDLKRITKSGYNGDLMFKMDSFAHAYKCNADTIKVYESWYA